MENVSGCSTDYDEPVLTVEATLVWKTCRWYKLMHGLLVRVNLVYPIRRSKTYSVAFRPAAGWKWCVKRLSNALAVQPALAEVLCSSSNRCSNNTDMLRIFGKCKVGFLHALPSNTRFPSWVQADESDG